MKKVLLFFAIMMMAIPASAKVYEVSFEKSENITIYGGNTKVINGVKITVNEGSIRPAASWEPRKGHMWNGDGTENDFQISTENGETITNIEITTEEESRWSIGDLYGTGWTKIATGISWTGSATSVNVGGEFEQVIKLTVTVDDAPTHTHNYATTWSTDATNHWHACTGTGTCDAPKKDVAAHSYGNVVTETAYYTCSVCQYENATRKAEHDAYLVMDANTDANTAKIFAKLGTVANVTINNLTIKGGKWSTICLPFDLSSSEIETAFGAGAEVAKLSSSSYDAANEALSLNFTSETEMEAGDPYVIKVTADVANPTFADVTLATYECQTVTTDYASMKGDFDKHFLNGGDKNTWFISNNTFYYPSEDGFLGATKCWFNLLGEVQQSSTSAKAKSIRMNIFGSEATAIHSVTPATKVSGNEVYNLQGVRVSNPTKKGIYIRNGVKMVVK